MQRGGDCGTVGLETIRGDLEFWWAVAWRKPSMKISVVADCVSQWRNSERAWYSVRWRRNNRRHRCFHRSLPRDSCGPPFARSPKSHRTRHLHRDVHDQASHDGGALFTGQHQQLHDGVAVQVGDAFGAPDRVAFDQQTKSEYNPILRNVASGQRGFVGLGVVFLQSGQRKRRRPLRCLPKR